ncbi:isopentenyldiphosphate isomerase [Bacillus ectoiniformans]|uniref:NUDIX hydrolase n=1 Tax=Bacillus ectoiniformans TaxID=1494429 RepID=UPI0019586849|nr:NUDIX domain-containing protein [Bacillus ectoiniformans]MBM7649939.1 isopentenyldiphosphate isomerase [Bacillus ectoiniformans]
MENEYFKIFDEERNEIGVASRKDVHRFGYWHETFHCWFVTKHKETDYIYLQLRSDSKEDYPSLLDITVAGHLAADEMVQDGVREIKEEVGIDVPYNDLEQLGIIEYCVIREDFIDKELAHVFLYISEHSLNDFIVQSDEVSGIVLAEFKDFSELWQGERETIKVSGFKIDKEGNRDMYVEMVGKDKFVPHQLSFYKKVIQKIKEQI